MNKIAYILRESLVARFLIPAGLMILVFGAVYMRISLQNQHFIETEATVTKVVLEEEAHRDTDGTMVDATYTVTVKHTVDGKEYEGELPGLNEMQVGEKMKVYYDPDDPTVLTMSISRLVPMIMMCAGLAAVIGGIVSAGNAVRKYRKMKEQEESWETGAPN